MPEVNRTNNFWHKKGVFGKVEPIKFEFLAGDNEPGKTQVWWTPMMGYNVYDKAMLGVLFHNQTIAKNKFEYTLLPMYSFGRKNVSGFANVKYNFRPATKFSMISIGAKARTFKNALAGYDSEYMVANPFVDFQIGKPKSNKHYKQNVLIQGVSLFEKTQSPIGVQENLTYGGFVEYGFDFAHRVNKFNAKVKVDYVDQRTTDLQLSNLNIELKYTFEYWDEKNKSIELRGYFGTNLFTNGITHNIYAFSPSGQTGSQDYFYDSYLMGRNELGGMWGQQRLNNQGGMNTGSPFGNSNTMLATINLFATLPYIPLIGFYSDFGIADVAGTTEVMYDLGVGIRLYEGNFGVYFPLLESQNMLDAYQSGATYGQRIKFVLNMNVLNPEKIMQKVL
jgi:hypothetical protein